MNMTIVAVIFRKEILDMLRDKRTLMAMIGIPVLLYPALFILGSQAAIMQMHKTENAQSRLAVTGPGAETLKGWLAQTPRLIVADEANPEAALRDGNLDAWIVTHAPIEELLAKRKTVSVEIRFDETETPSREASRRIAETLQKKKQELLSERLSARGLSEDFVQPLKVESTSIASPAKRSGTVLGMVLPILLIAMLAMGAFYPAIDITAGEKERGTFETLLSTPTSKVEIVLGKFLTVFALAMLTGLLNLGSMLATLAFQFSNLKHEIGAFDIQFPPEAAAVLLLVLVPLAFFISAVMMSIAVFCRNFKEAQNFLAPFLLLLVLPPAFAAPPGAKLSLATQFIPITNVVLLFRGLLMGTATAQQIFAVLVSTTVFAALALAVAVWIFQREEVILAEERGIPLSMRRADFIPRLAPTSGLAIAQYALALLLIFYVGSYLQTQNLFWGLLATQWMLILPVAVLIPWFFKVRLASCLNLQTPTPGAFGATLLMAPSVTILLLQLGAWHNRTFPMPQEMADIMAGLFKTQETGVGVWALLAIIALSPAICEELLFRGALLSGLRQSLPGWAAVALVGGMFGLFHLTIYRVLLTGIMGVVLAYMVFRSRSIYLSMFTHFIVNAFAVLTATQKLPAPLQARFNDGSLEQHGLPWGVLLVAITMLVTGIAIMETWGKPRSSPEIKLDTYDRGVQK